MKTLFKALVTAYCLFIVTLVHAAGCPEAISSSTPGFCNSFQVAAECHCVSKGLPRGMCTNVNLLFKRMIDTLGTVQRACEFQHETTSQLCVDDWNCYRYGGVNSSGQLCSGTGNACV